MKIELKKFGTTLISRQTGKEALAAFAPNLVNIDINQKIEIDFSGVVTFSPSWGDEFLSPLLRNYGDNVFLSHTENPSVVATLKILEQVNGRGFTVTDSESH